MVGKVQLLFSCKKIQITIGSSAIDYLKELILNILPLGKCQLMLPFVAAA